MNDLEVLLRSLRDPAYWIQCITASAAVYLVIESRKKRQLRKWYANLGFMMILAGIFAGIHLLLSFITLKYRLFAGIGTFMAYLGGVAIYAVLFLSYDIKARIVNTAAIASIIITIFELGAVFGRVLQAVYGIDSLITKSAACLVLFFISLSMRRCWIGQFYVSKAAAWLNTAACAASAICVISFDMFAVHIFAQGGDVSINTLMTIVFAALVEVDLVCYYMAYNLSKEYTRVIDLNAENQMNKAAEQLMTLTEENLSDLHKIRHDIQNQYAYMQALLEKGDLEGLQSYFEELTSTFAEPLGAVEDYGNHVMNLIFGIERAKANRSSVALNVRAAVPHTLPFTDLDLVKLYTNVVDNAIEACVSEDIDTAGVDIVVQLHGEYLFSRVVNPTRKSKHFLTSGAMTTKKDAKMHGKGISIIRDIIKKYDGTIQYSIENGEFVVEFMIKMQEKNHE